jgi:hypothetical protein
LSLESKIFFVAELPAEFGSKEIEPSSPILVLTARIEKSRDTSGEGPRAESVAAALSSEQAPKREDQVQAE